MSGYVGTLESFQLRTFQACFSNLLHAQNRHLYSVYMKYDTGK